MSDTPEGSKEARAAEAAAIRRRWITLGEVLAVTAVLISGTTLWLNWSEHSDEQAGKVAESRQASARAGTLVLNATAQDGHRLLLRPASPDQIVQSQTIRFPAALGLAPVDTTGDPRIEVTWFENGLKKARDRASLPDNSRGDERLPVAITTRFLVDGKPHEDKAVYDIGYSIAGRWFSGHRLTLRGLSLVHGGYNALDTRWSAITAAAKPK